jgi:hypothetical protein
MPTERRNPIEAAGLALRLEVGIVPIGIWEFGNLIGIWSVELGI